MWTHAGRALLMFLVPLLFFHGYLTFAAFLLVFFAHGFLQSTSITAGSVAFNRILGPDTTYYNRANAYFNVVMNVVGVIGPMLAGAFIGAMDARYGLLSGNALAYGVYGAAALAVAVGYGVFLKIPRDEAVQAARSLAKSLKGDARVRGVVVGQVDGKQGLLVESSGDPAELADLPATHEGFPVKAVARRRVLKELGEGFDILRKTRFLKLYLVFSFLSLMASDSLVFMALPRYIEDVLHSAAVPGVAALHSIPVIGSAVAGLTSKGGAFGLYLAASSLGMGVSSVAMAARREKAPSELSALGREFRAQLASRGVEERRLDAAVSAVVAAPDAVLARYVSDWKGRPEAGKSQGDFAADLLLAAADGLAGAGLPGAADAAQARALMDQAGLSRALSLWAARNWPALERDARKTAKSGLDALERQGRWTSIVNGLGWLAYGGVFLTHNLWLSVGSMIVALLLQGPAAVVWTSLTQRVITDAAPESMGKAYGAMYFIQLVLSIAGALLFGWLLSAFSTPLALLVAAAIAAACAVLDIVVPYVIFPTNRGKGTKR